MLMLIPCLPLIPFDAHVLYVNYSLLLNGFISTCISCMYTQCNIILTSIHVVNCLNIVLPTCRYSKISLVYSKFFKLWPAYVHWARGNFHLAANDFASALPSFEGKI